MNKKNRISVFGGSLTKPGEADYDQAFKLGKLLGRAGFTVQTGGYMGTMEAVSRGAAEAGGHVIGMTCDEIESWRPVGPNPWVGEEQRFATTRDRLFGLIDSCDAALALPGGIGTLAEVAEMWSQMQTTSIRPRPLILIGAGWQTTIATFQEHFPRYIHPPHLEIISYAPDVDSAIALLQTKLSHPGNPTH